MKTTSALIATILLLLQTGASPCLSQDRGSDALVKPKSAGKAFGLSLLVPGLGHRYVRDGDWGRNGATFLAIDAAALLGVGTSIWREGQAIQSYETLAALEAGADLPGKSRAFLINLGTYDSSDELIEALLRSRRWDRLEGARDPDAQWVWSSTESRRQYSELRDRAESLDRRASIWIGTMVANRLISGVLALRSARKAGRNVPAVSLRPNPASGAFPVIAQVSLRW